MLTIMAKVCAITGKTSQVGGGYSNRTRATQFNPVGLSRRYANLHKKKIFVPELNKSFILTLSAKGIKTIQKKGPYAALKDAGII
jgi:large subunit ribosomal protein L28